MEEVVVAGAREIRLSRGYYLTKSEEIQFCGYNGLDEEFDAHVRMVEKHTALSAQKLWILYLLLKQCVNLPGEFVECGVHSGGSARFIAQMIPGKILRLFDTFTGMPETDPEMDWHRKGEFDNAPIEEVKKFVGHYDRVIYHPGLIPETFWCVGHKKFAFAHVDVDIYSSMKACCEFLYPRMVPGGIMLLDDYGQPTCQGARIAIDEYFADKRSVPVSLGTNQAIVFNIGG